MPALQEVITARDVRFNETAFFDPKEEVKDPVTVTEYYPMAEILAVPDKILEFDLDVGDLVSINNAAESHADLQVLTSAYSQRDNLAGSGLPAVNSPMSAISESQNSGVVAKETSDTSLGLGFPTPESIQLPDSPTVDLEYWIDIVVLSPYHGEDNTQERDTIVVNIGLSNEDSLPGMSPVPEETAIDPDLRPAGSGNDVARVDLAGDAHSRADPRENTPTEGTPTMGASPAKGQQR